MHRGLGRRVSHRELVRIEVYKIKRPLMDRNAMDAWRVEAGGGEREGMRSHSGFTTPSSHVKSLSTGRAIFHLSTAGPRSS